MILKIQPTSVQINTLDRPGTVPNLRGATSEELEKVKDFWQMDNVEIIAKPKKSKIVQSYRKDTDSAILETVVRRPCTVEDLTEMLGTPACEIQASLQKLEAEGKIEKMEQERGSFYQIKGR